MKLSQRKFFLFKVIRGTNKYRRRWVTQLQRVGVVATFLVVLGSTTFLTNVKNEAFVMAPSSSSGTVSGAVATFASSLAKEASSVAIKNAAAAAATTNIAAAAPSAPVPVVGHSAWLNSSLYVDPNNTAAIYAHANPGAANITLLAKMGQQPVATWFGDWNSNVTASVNSVVSAANASRSVPVLVFYNIPDRDCGGYSATGSLSYDAYIKWVKQAAAGIANRQAVVILEPDALAGADCLPVSNQTDRYEAISQAVGIIKAQANASVYIDAGNPSWHSPASIASRLSAANIAGADGFSLDVSSFSSTNQNISYGEQISPLVGGKHYVIDSSRSGGSTGTNGAAYNPPGAALGPVPTTHTANAHNDALLWVKIPWESDAPVNGGPNAGEPFWSYAIQLAQNAGW